MKRHVEMGLKEHLERTGLHIEVHSNVLVISDGRLVENDEDIKFQIEYDCSIEGVMEHALWFLEEYNIEEET